MACSYCREKGHTKRSCPKQKEEKIKIQRDRTNMFISVFPALIANPVIMGLMWWQFSKLFPFTRFFNNLVVGQTAIDAIPFLDVDVQALPQPIVLGSALQVAEDTQDYVNWLKEQVEQGLDVSYTRGFGEGGALGQLTNLFGSIFEGIVNYEPPKVVIK